MRRFIIAAVAVFGSVAYAQTPPLKTSDVAIDAAGKCWVRGPANVLTEVPPVLGTAVPVTSATQVLAKGVWIVVSSAGVATVVVSDGTAVTGVAAGSAYPV